MSDDRMQVDEVQVALGRALELQGRSVVQQTTVAAALTGLEFQGVADRIWSFAQSELADLRLLTEKLVAVGGAPVTTIAPFEQPADARKALSGLVDAEEEAVSELHAVIPLTGQEPRSEALEHLLEHALQRKQEQIDWLRRALG